MQWTVIGNRILEDVLGSVSVRECFRFVNALRDQLNPVLLLSWPGSSWAAPDWGASLLTTSSISALYSTRSCSFRFCWSAAVSKKWNFALNFYNWWLTSGHQSPTIKIIQTDISAEYENGEMNIDWLNFTLFLTFNVSMTWIFVTNYAIVIFQWCLHLQR